MSNTSKIITPTVGRKVWYRHCAEDLMGEIPMTVAGTGQPLDATIIAVWGDRMVNVLVTDAVGKQFPVMFVTLLQDGDEPARAANGNICGRFVEWMPCQKGQSSKAAAAANNDHASAVLYPAIKAAMDELSTLPPSFNVTVNRAFNHLHRAFWSEVPAPASAHPLRPERACTCGPSEACSRGEGDLGFVKTGA